MKAVLESQLTVQVNEKGAEIDSAPFVFLRAAAFGLCPQGGLQIGFGSCDRTDVEVLHEKVEHVRGDECRQCRSELDVLDPQVEEGEEDDDRLLLIPGEDE